jgi:hypothetical protein
LTDNRNYTGVYQSRRSLLSEARADEQKNSQKTKKSNFHFCFSSRIYPSPKRHRSDSAQTLAFEAI